MTVGSASTAPLAPRWKSFVVTLLAVYPSSLAIHALLDPVTRTWPSPASLLLVSACLVAGMTYVTMPLATRALARWLSADGRRDVARAASPFVRRRP